nr:GNAT family N-acetyltransferase [Amycolatopsis acididurans]
MHIRGARAGDVEPIVAMLADDPLGRSRESPGDLAPYRAAFERIAADPGQLLVVAEAGGEIVGTMQLSFIPGLSHRGAVRAQIEAVRVRADRRGGGFGATMIKWAIEEARNRGCAVVQLTSNVSRERAHAFYQRLGFEQSHKGFKIVL